jgi:hypothetical protein
MAISCIDSGDVMETRNGSGIGNNRNGSDGSVITINIGRGNLQFNFFKKNGRILTNGLEKGGPSTKIVMKHTRHVLVITKSERANMSRLGNETRKGEDGRSGGGDGGSDWLRTLRRGANRDGHDNSDDGLRVDGKTLLGSRFRVKFQRQ